MNSIGSLHRGCLNWATITLLLCPVFVPAASPPVVSLELIDPVAAETRIDQNAIFWAEFRVQRSGSATNELTVFLNTQQGTARLGEDYWLDRVNNGSSVGIPAGTNSINVRLYPIDDDYYEGDETVFFHLIAPPAGTPASGQYEIDLLHSSVDMVIHDNDPVATRLDITSPHHGQLFQPGDTIELRAQIIGPSSSDIWSVDFFDGSQRIGTTRPNQAIWWSDAPGGQHLISARATNAQGTVLISTPTVTIQVGPGAALPVVKIGANPWRTAEPCPTCLVAPGILVIERTVPTNAALTVFLDIDGTATPGDDYQELPSNVEIPAGQHSVQIPLLARDDQQVEGPEIVRVRVLPQPPPLQPPTYFVNVYAKEALLVISDDEPGAPVARLDIVAPSNGAHLQFPSTVALSALAVYTQNEVYGPVEFYAGDQLIARSPLNAFARPPVPGVPSVHTAYWSNPPVGSYVLTARTRLSFNLSITSPPVNVTVDAPILPVVSLETFPLQNAHAPEFCPPNADCAYPSFIVRRGGPTNADLRVYLSYAGTATAGVDYPALSNSVVIPAGRATAFLMLVPRDDTLVEGPETVIARFTPVPAPYIQDPNHASATITISDNDLPPSGTVVRIEATSPIAEEDSRPLRRLRLVGAFTISRSGPTNASIPVYVQFSGSATAGEDYPTLPWVVSIPAGATSTEIQVIPAADGKAEGIETVLATISNCPPPWLLPPCYDFDLEPAHSSATVFIRDDGITRASVTITNPLDGADFDVGEPIRIDAVAISLDGLVRRVNFFADGAQIGESNVQLDPPEAGRAQSFSFVWHNASPGSHELTAVALDGSGNSATSAPIHIAVAASEPLPIVSVTARDAFAVEPHPNIDLNTATFRLRRFGPTNDALVVSYSLHGTADNGGDYELLPGITTIPAGRRTVDVIVRPLADNLREGRETVRLRVEEPPPSTPENRVINPYRVGHPSQAVAVISDEPWAPAAGAAHCFALSDGARHLCFAADGGGNFRIEASPDLLNWETLFTTLGIDGAWHFVDADAENRPCRFYRLRLEPGEEVLP
jgi:hypothetical protein